MSEKFTAERLLLEDLSEQVSGFVSRQDARISDFEKKLDILDEAVAKVKTNGGGSSTITTSNLKAELDTFGRTGRPRGDLMRTNSDPDGGVTLPLEINKEILKVAKESVTMRKLARVVVGGPDYRQIVNPEGPEVGWGAEQTPREDTDTPTLTAVNFIFGEMYAVLPITNWLLEDSTFDLGNWILEGINTAFAKAENDTFLTGNGVGRPKGVLDYTFESGNDSTRDWGKLQYVASGSSSTLSHADKLVDLVYSLRPGYHMNASWVMHPATANVVRKFKNGEGAYLWVDSLASGQPPTLLGYPVHLDEFAPLIGSDELPILFGDFRSAYTIVDHRAGLKLIRDPYTSKGITKFFVYRRVAGAVCDFHAVKALKIAAS